MSKNERTATILNKRGLHARAAAKFSSLAGEFNAEICVSRKGQTVSARSIMGLMMLAASAGTDVTLTATGPDAKAALNAICSLIADHFQED
ncbi:MAG: HPr family phosphocarrier protein [Rhodospirillaceae bacterium TMED8]|nr:HPr family phosphocarrier protein [Magnetovibrio sp.]OUT53229.1 MAG: HPr family phosphocarrier protein [Rhodospirillaceae bacterium TMED8]